ncbi:hypothetical protein HBN54_000276 [Hymenobacter sp. 1B]|uniref:Uncharacterized protein n=1 Tax=Hymenobacter artigasi TaxID=2719616 RepID=A0ABX1HF48_9BACT|nr:hypothetical protein [Hymenobacter artigasi]
MTFQLFCSEPRSKFAFPKSGLTLQLQTHPTMFQTRYFFGYYTFYATA